MINKLLIIILLLIIIIFNLSQYENFDNINFLNIFDEFNKTDLETYDKKINKNLEILNNLMKTIKSKINDANLNKDKKINKINTTTNKTFASKNKVQGLFKSAGLI